ncbi:MAG TPA: RodZ domain-containing protein [Bacteroidota bacterium]|jgi:transcriptional regulator with XRE-family HTH domain|nr:RodZ domain-containing protein [Bacteroidota bacterium]
MTAMRDIGERLHAARVQQKISLEDIAAATRISIKFLEELERGAEPAVPPTYVKAFIKAFAERVGVDANELLRQYASAKLPADPAKPFPDEPYAASRPEGPVAIPRVKASKNSNPKQLKPLLTLIAILLAGLLIFVLWLRNERKERSVQEISFNDVVKEQESKKEMPVKRDTIPAGPLMKPAPEPADSLDLEAVAASNVWVHLTIDGKGSQQYMMTKFSHLHWKAKTAFLISVGNASAVSLSLNGQKVAIAANDTLPAKNISLSRETLKKPQPVPVPKKENP